MYFISVVTFLAFIHRVVRQRRATLAITNKWKSYKTAHKKTVQILGGLEKAITCWNIFILMLFNSGRRLLARHQTGCRRCFLLLLWPDPQHQPTHCIVYQFMGTLKSRSHFKFELEHETPITSLSPYVLMISSDPLWDGWLVGCVSLWVYRFIVWQSVAINHVHSHTAMVLILGNSRTEICGV